VSRHELETPGREKVRLQRAYEAPSSADGVRVLVDRLWPWGVSKQIASSAGLRRWFGHNPDRWQEFRIRYVEELSLHEHLLTDLRSIARRKPLTLVYSAHDERHNDAVVLRDVLLGK
jgi:uncharacterized protein YeaO (DUF488 family)